MRFVALETAARVGTLKARSRFVWVKVIGARANVTLFACGALQICLVFADGVNDLLLRIKSVSAIRAGKRL